MNKEWSRLAWPGDRRGEKQREFDHYISNCYYLVDWWQTGDIKAWKCSEIVFFIWSEWTQLGGSKRQLSQSHSWCFIQTKDGSGHDEQFSLLWDAGVVPMFHTNYPNGKFLLTEPKMFVLLPCRCRINPTQGLIKEAGCGLNSSCFADNMAPHAQGAESWRMGKGGLLNPVTAVLCVHPQASAWPFTKLILLYLIPGNIWAAL